MKKHLLIILYAFLAFGLIAGGQAFASDHPSYYSPSSCDCDSDAVSTETTAPGVLRATSSQMARLISGQISSVLAPRNPYGTRPGTPGQFSLDSSSINLAQADLPLNSGSGLASGDAFMQGFAMWGNLGWTRLRNTYTPTEQSGNHYNFTVGADHLVFGDRGVVGMALSHEQVNMFTDFNDGRLNTKGWTIAPYGAVKLGDQTMLDLMFAYTRVSATTERNRNIGLITGKTDNDRLMVAANLTHYIFHQRWTFAPQFSILYADERTGGYTESNNSRVDSFNTKLGQFGVGGTVSYSWNMFEPYFTAKYIYDFARDKANIRGVEIAGAANDRDEFFTALGINVNATQRLACTLEVSHGFDRSQTRDTAVMGSLRMEF